MAQPLSVQDYKNLAEKIREWKIGDISEERATDLTFIMLEKHKEQDIYLDARDDEVMDKANMRRLKENFEDKFDDEISLPQAREIVESSKEDKTFDIYRESLFDVLKDIKKKDISHWTDQEKKEFNEYFLGYIQSDKFYQLALFKDKKQREQVEFLRSRFNISEEEARRMVHEIQLEALKPKVHKPNQTLRKKEDNLLSRWSEDMEEVDALGYPRETLRLLEESYGDDENWLHEAREKLSHIKMLDYNTKQWNTVEIAWKKFYVLQPSAFRSWVKRWPLKHWLRGNRYADTRKNRLWLNSDNSFRDQQDFQKFLDRHIPWISEKDRAAIFYSLIIDESLWGYDEYDHFNKKKNTVRVACMKPFWLHPSWEMHSHDPSRTVESFACYPTIWRK